MANRGRREFLRGAEEETFDLLAEVWTSDQWAELLKAPLEHAARQGNRALAQKLVRAGAEMGYALHKAIRGGHGDVASDLLESGAPVDARNNSRYDRPTPLHVATIEGETEMVQLLLVKGADKDSMKIDGSSSTPVYLATVHGHVATALALMAAGADVTLRYGSLKKSVAHLAARAGYVDVLRAAIEHGADVDTAAKGGWTPLHFASRNNRVGAINVLLEAGARIKARDRHGRTSLHHAACKVNLAAALALLKHGAHVNAQDEKKETPLHWAARNAGRQGTVEVVDSLLRSGADETTPNRRGEAAADVVAKGVNEEDQLVEEVECVRELLANAPADRAWRRRGHLVVCRAHPHRMRQIQDISSSPASMARRTCSGTEIRRTGAVGCGGFVGASPVDARNDDDWAVVVARVLVLQEEGIFRTIVGYL